MSDNEYDDRDFKGDSDDDDLDDDPEDVELMDENEEEKQEDGNGDAGVRRGTLRRVASSERITSRFMTKYERARILGSRAL